MDITTRVKNALSGILPVAFGKWEEAPYPSQYGVFTTLSTPHSSSDDEVDETLHYVYLEMYSTINYIAKKESVHVGMKAAGFQLFEERGTNDQLTMTWTFLEAV